MADTGYAQYMRKYRVLIQNKSGKITASDSPAAASAADGGQRAVCTGNMVNFRSGPSTSYKSYGHKWKGDSLTVVGKSGSWYILSMPDLPGGIAYMYGQYVKVTGADVGAGSLSGTVTVQTALDVSDLRCQFYCEKNLDETPNYSQITIFNPSQATVAAIQPGDTVVLEAGYENGNYGMIFMGQIVQPYVSKEGGTDTALHLVVQDGDSFLTSAFTAQTISAGATQQDIIDACLSEDVAKGLITPELSRAQLPRGKVIFGKSAEYINRIAGMNQSQFYIEDGKINIVAAADYDKAQAVELNPMTGLIGMPSQTDDGVSGQCLINPSIKLNTLVYINQSLVAQSAVKSADDSIQAINADGVYRIVRLVYEGDTRGDTWYCTFEAITQSGAKPDGLKNGATNPWR